jgi:predicted phage terminase large subunit-like protein
MTKKQVVFSPASEKQKMFLTCDADIIVYGGGAGSGKSYCSIIKSLEGLQDPFYRAVFIRNTRGQLLKSGALWDTAKQVYRNFGAKFNNTDLKATFPSGARIDFGFLDRAEDRYNYDGSQLTQIFIDEAQHMADADTVLYMLSRNRSQSKCKHQLILTCNPLCGTYLHQWVDWYLDKDTGIPDPDKIGVYRYLINKDGKVFFYNSKKEAIDKNPEFEEKDVMSFCFISAFIDDNPKMAETNPRYVSRLKGLRGVEKDRLLLGSWTAKESASGYFKREWVNMVPTRPTGIGHKRVRAWDISGSIPSEALPDPDYTVGVLMSRSRIGHYTIEHIERDRLRAHGVLELIIQTAINDGTDVEIVIPADPGAAGKAYAQSIVRELAERGFSARVFTTNQSKITRFSPFACIAEARQVSVVRGEWNDAYFNELEIFDGSRKNHDDCVDATSDCFKYLAQNSLIPSNFVLPDMSRVNNFNFN